MEGALLPLIIALSSLAKSDSAWRWDSTNHIAYNLAPWHFDGPGNSIQGPEVTPSPFDFTTQLIGPRNLGRQHGVRETSNESPSCSRPSMSRSINLRRGEDPRVRNLDRQNEHRFFVIEHLKMATPTRCDVAVVATYKNSFRQLTNTINLENGQQP